MTDLRSLSFDPELTPGARNAVRVCLRVEPGEKVTLIADIACAEIAAAIARELDEVGAVYTPFVLEDLAPRPLADMPAAILDDMESSTVSIYAVESQPNELKHAHADDRRGESPENSPRTHGQH